jgi:hypothetical protein
MDEILTNVTIYSLTETIGSSMRMYHANSEIPAAQQARRVEVPSGFTLFPGNISRAPRTWLERTANLVRFTQSPAAGTSRHSKSPISTRRNYANSSARTGPDSAGRVWRPRPRSARHRRVQRAARG